MLHDLNLFLNLRNIYLQYYNSNSCNGVQIFKLYMREAFRDAFISFIVNDSPCCALVS
jgi:hypothetical protein